MEISAIVLLIGFILGFHLQGKKAKERYQEYESKIFGLNQVLEKFRRDEIARLETQERQRKFFQENDVSKADNQIKFVSQCGLYPTRPVNREASRILYILDDWISANQPKWRVSFEVAMGSFIKTTNKVQERVRDLAFSSYNSKRVDFLIIDSKGYPKVVIEYHGSGHDLSEDSSDRMSVKRLALKQARIPLIEVLPREEKQSIYQRLDECMRPSDDRTESPT